MMTKEITEEEPTLRKSLLICIRSLKLKYKTCLIKSYIFKDNQDGNDGDRAEFNFEHFDIDGAFKGL